jgi:hypothetical protein
LSVACDDYFFFSFTLPIHVQIEIPKSSNKHDSEIETTLYLNFLSLLPLQIQRPRPLLLAPRRTILLKPPSSTLIQSQRIVPCLLLAAYLLGPAITIFVLAADDLHPLVFVAEQGA